MVDASNQKQ